MVRLPRYMDSVNARGRITVRKYIREAIGFRNGSELPVWVRAFPSAEDCRALLLLKVTGERNEDPSTKYDRLDARGRLTIPEDYREALGVKPGVISPIIVEAYPDLMDIQGILIKKL